MLTDAMFRELVWKLAGLLVAISAVFGFAGYLLFLGFWKKTLQPLVLTEIKTFLDTASERDRHKEMIQKTVEDITSRQDSIAARDQAVEKVVSAMRNRPESVDARKKEIVDEIDNQVRRDDGLIYGELDKRFKRSEESNTHRMDQFESRLLREIAPLKESFERIVKIESMLHVMMKWGKFPTNSDEG